VSVSRNLLARLAGETGFRAETLEKVIHLGELAADVSRHPLLSRALVLKGGTALNLCFGSPRRLSVDLDFNYILSVDREAMLRDRPEVERAIDTVARGRGYRVQWSSDEHAGRKVYLGYLSASGTPDRIEVDLNFLFRLPLAEPEVRMAAMAARSKAPKRGRGRPRGSGKPVALVRRNRMVVMLTDGELAKLKRLTGEETPARHRTL
jgi:predicted nucleotidyltransferase component of viral defense system